MQSQNPNIYNDLLKGEVILWEGRPTPSINFNRKDLFLIPFSIVWGSFAFYWEGLVVWQSIIKDTGMPLIFPIWGIPFVLAGMYFIFGRFIYKKIKKDKTWYFLTNKRAIIYCNLGEKNINTANLSSTSTYNISTQSNGYGTITFGQPSFLADMYANTGMDFFGKMYGLPTPAFYDIKDAEIVYRLALETNAQTVQSENN